MHLTSTDPPSANKPTPTDRQILPVPNATKPYWRSDLHEIDSYRSTEGLPSACDIAIIGAGMSGVSTAYHIVQQSSQTANPKPSIVILEAREVCSGATGRNGGHIKVLTPGMLARIEEYGLEAAEAAFAFQQAHIEALKEVVEKEGLECEFELRRSLDVLLDAEEARTMEERFRMCVRQGQKWTRVVDMVPKEVVEQVTSIKGAKLAFNTPACSLWPYKFVSQLLARMVERKQVNLQTHTPVHRISRNHPDTDTKDAQVTILHTPRGTLAARTVIYATNAYTSGIAATYSGVITPKRAAASHQVPQIPIKPHLSNTYNITYSPGRTDYLNPRPDGGIVVGGGQWTYSLPCHDRGEWWDNWDDSSLLTGTEAYFGGKGYMQARFAGWEESGTRMESLWTGVIGTTSDGVPHVGAVPGSEGKEWILAGFNGGGMPIIFLCARGVARMVLDHEVGFGDTGIPASFQTSWERVGGSEGQS